MIRIETHDTILDIVNKMNSSTKEEILLEFPFGHSVLHNRLFLQILKAKAGNKRLTIVTSDILSRKIGSKLGIRYVINENQDNYTKAKGKRHLLKHNFTFFEFLMFEIRRVFRSLWKKVSTKKLKDLQKKSAKNNLKYSFVSLLLIGLLSSCLLIIFIFYFAVNKTYIYITPEINIVNKSQNFIYGEKVNSDNLDIEIEQERDNFVEIKPIEETLSLTETYQTKTIDYDSTKRASGKAKLINELPVEQTLRVNTRLLTEDGIIFRIQKWVTIPPTTTDENGNRVLGQSIVDIVADLYDENGNFIGERGNMDEATMILPGLTSNRDKIYAYLEGPTTGGADDYSFVVGEQDLKESLASIEEKLKKQVLEKIKNNLREQNKENKTNYEILNISNIIDFEDLKSDIAPGIKIGDKLDRFEVVGSIKAKTFVYDKTKVINSLHKLALSGLLEGSEKLNFLDENSVRFSNIIEKKENPIRIKATTQVEIGINYDFENDSNARVQKIKQTIMGQDIQKAKEFLLDIDEIKNIKIKNSPFFVKTVSNRENNIIIKIKDN